MIATVWRRLRLLFDRNRATREIEEEMALHRQLREESFSRFGHPDPASGARLMGFGHRVYKNFDPRAKLIKKTCSDVLMRLQKQTRLLDLAMELEDIALRDDYFVERKLYPNVDFYSGIIYQAIGIPVDMFTVLFAIGRLPGWIAHWMEMHKQGFRISRPRQIYTGATERPITPIAKRG